MDIQRKIREEKIQNIDYTNQEINRLISYSNILNTGCRYLKDNGITNFLLIDYINDSDKTRLIDNDSFCTSDY